LSQALSFYDKRDVVRAFFLRGEENARGGVIPASAFRGNSRGGSRRARSGHPAFSTLKHSLILTAVIGIFAFLQAYVLQWMAPVYKAAVVAAPFSPTEGVSYLGITAVVIFFVIVISMIMGKAEAE
jgi:hypothetical protein